MTDGRQHRDADLEIVAAMPQDAGQNVHLALLIRSSLERQFRSDAKPSHYPYEHPGVRGVRPVGRIRLALIQRRLDLERGEDMHPAREVASDDDGRRKGAVALRVLRVANRGARAR